VLLDREGKRLAVLSPPGRYADPAISPNGDRLAYARADPPTGATNIYVVSIARPVSWPFTVGPHRNRAPVWSPDGTRIAFESISQTTPGRGLYVRTLDVAKEDRVSDFLTPTDWSRNGFIIGDRRQRTGGIFFVPSSGASAPQAFLDTESNELSPSFSPDGRWVAYQSNKTGQVEVYA